MKVILYFFLPILLLLSCYESDAPLASITPPKITVIDLCKETNGIGDYGLDQEHGSKIYYNKKITVTEDTILVAFDFFELCCLEFKGTWEIKEDILYLFYEQKDASNVGCECRCNYRMKFEFDSKHYNWKHVRIIKNK